MQPPVPSVEEQAQFVADFISAMAARANLEDLAVLQDKLSKLRRGNLEEIFLEYSEEPIEKFRSSIPDFSEFVMLKRQPTDQLHSTYLAARAHVWGTENGQPMLWKEWDSARKRADMAQNSSVAAALQSVKLRSQQVASLAHAKELATAAMEMPGRTVTEVQGLAETLLEEMFVTTRIAYPIHTSQALILPLRIPSWVWFGGLMNVVPGWWKLKETEPSRSLIASLVIATHPFADHMTRFLSGPGPELRETRKDPSRRTTDLQLTSQVEVPEQVFRGLPFLKTTKTTEETLEHLNTKLLARKNEGAALLKVHLDLMNQAFATGGVQPLFRYDFREAAERLGYKKPTTRRGYDAGTLQEIYNRILTLRGCLIHAYEMTNGSGKERLRGRVSYWKIESFEDLEGEEAITPYQSWLTGKPVTPFVSLIVQPGMWWPLAEMGNFHLRIPSSILKLDTSGRNEVNRTALKLAASLAVWERMNTTRHGGGSIEVTVRHLAEKASIFTAEELAALGNKASRMRDQLSQAFEVLKSHDAFDVTIVDLQEYDATGRGWMERFLDAKLSMSIRVLEPRKVRKSDPKELLTSS